MCVYTCLLMWCVHACDVGVRALRCACARGMHAYACVFVSSLVLFFYVCVCCVHERVHACVHVRVLWLCATITCMHIFM